MERKKKIAAERGYTSAAHVGYTRVHETHELGAGYTQEDKCAPRELNAHEVHEFGHSSRRP